MGSKVEKEFPEGLVVEVINAGAPPPPCIVDPRCCIVNADDHTKRGRSMAHVFDHGHLAYVWDWTDTDDIPGEDNYALVFQFPGCNTKSVEEKRQDCRNLSRIDWFGPPGSRFLATPCTAPSGATSLSLTPLPSTPGSLFRNFSSPCEGTGSIFTNNASPSAFNALLSGKSSPLGASSKSSSFADTSLFSKFLLPFGSSSSPSANTETFVSQPSTSTGKPSCS